jgi:4-amino-4-deoxy-L-arabinose transferase-like glycosyltransferase
MASRASSDPRTVAPGTPVPIPSLPKLGTTWYRRGALYWLSRARTTVFLLLVMAFVCFFSLSLYQGFRSEMPATARTVCDGLQVAASGAALIWGWVTQRRSHRAALRHPPTPAETRAAKRDHDTRAPGRIAAGRGLVLLAAPVMPAFAAYITGWLTAWLTVREYPSEVGARRWMEEHTS